MMTAIISSVSFLKYDGDARSDYYVSSVVISQPWSDSGVSQLLIMNTKRAIPM